MCIGYRNRDGFLLIHDFTKQDTFYSETYHQRYNAKVDFTERRFYWQDNFITTAVLLEYTKLTIAVSVILYSTARL